MTSSATPASPTALRKVGVILGLLAYLAVGFLYFTSGLVVPGLALLMLWGVWLVGVWGVARLVARWSWWVWAAAPAAFLFWALYLTVGENLFGWTA